MARGLLAETAEMTLCSQTILCFRGGCQGLSTRWHRWNRTKMLRH
jgi:hypothetical protein